MDFDSMPLMVVDSEIHHLSIPKRFFAYTHAYRSAAVALCQKMAADRNACNWPNASVVLMLSAHSVELFLKGAIYFRDPSADVEHHRIDDLLDEYSKRYPEPSFAWDAPFKVEYAGFTDAEIQMIKKTVPIPSILYRYPVNRGGKEWNTTIGFVPDTFLAVLDTMSEDFARIEALLT